jgi:hypothetical protein
MKKLTAAALSITLVLSACAGDAVGGPGPDMPGDTVILTIRDEGGFAPVEMLFGRHPRLVLLADGRVYTPGPVPAIYPGPMLTPILVGTLDQATISQILDLVADAGLTGIDRQEDTSATSHVADATTTVITYFDGVQERMLSVYALGIAREASDLARRAEALVSALDRAVGGVDTELYRPSAIEVRTGDRLGLPDPDFRTTRPWPLPMDPDELPATAHGWRCVVIGGAIAGELLEEFSMANQATVWEHAGTEHALIARSLMPGEPGCA